MRKQGLLLTVLFVTLSFCLLGTNYTIAQGDLTSYTIEYKPHDGDKVTLSIVITDMHDAPLANASVTIKGAGNAALATAKSDEKGKCQIVINKEQWSNRCLFLAAEVVGYGKRVVKMQYGPGVYLIHLFFTPHEGFIVKSNGT